MTVTQSPFWKTSFIPLVYEDRSKKAVSDALQPVSHGPHMTPQPRPAQTLTAQRNLRSKRPAQDRASRAEMAMQASERQRNRAAHIARGAKCKSQVGDRLVDFATDLVVTTWPSDVVSREMVRHFIAEAVRRSCTSYALLQLAVYYVTLARDWAQKRRKDDPHALDDCPTLGCGRRVFLAALVVAHKYHIDRSFGATAWSKISCLPSTQIVAMELDLLKALDWKVHVPYLKFAEWCRNTFTGPLLLAKLDPAEKRLLPPMALSPQLQLLTPDNSPVS